MSAESRTPWKFKNLLRKNGNTLDVVGYQKGANNKLLVSDQMKAGKLDSKAGGTIQGNSVTSGGTIQVNSASGGIIHGNSGGTGQGNTGTAQNSTTTSTSLNNCRCCGTVLAYPAKSTKFRCSVCNTTTLLKYKTTVELELPHTLSYKYIRYLVDECFSEITRNAQEIPISPDLPSHSKSIHEIFEPLSKSLYDSFRSYECLNRSFITPSTRARYSTSNINYSEIIESFNLLLRLPTKRPLYNALCGAYEATRRVYTGNEDDPRSLTWILILLEIPFLSRSLNGKLGTRHMYDFPEIRNLSYDILKRCIGILSQLFTPKTSNYLASWFSKLSVEDFITKLDLLNLYITFHLRKYFYLANTKNQPLKGTRTDPDYLNNIPAKEDEDELAIYSPQIFTMLKKQKLASKIRIHQYGNDWHIRTCVMVLSTFWRANSIREMQVAASCFYNSLVDYVNMKLDFDVWQQYSRRNTDSEIQSVLEYIHGSTKSAPPSASFFICQYPFLISLGGKISILEYEAKRQMESKAEEAFINSLDKRIAIDVYFRVKVRRECIVQDSLLAIRLSLTDNLKKSLRVLFINEPGIDAGGLKKEWFFLLTKAIFNPQTGMLYNVEDSNYLWFNVLPIENFEMYYLFGSILGLAIYNSTILDLNFPRATYKLLLEKELTVEDYQEIFPVSYNNLMKLKLMSNQDLDSIGLTMEVSFADVFGKVSTAELCKNGSQIQVGAANLDAYIKLYWSFYLQDGIAKQVKALQDGFLTVAGGNGLSIFLAEEIQLLLCGNEESDIDVDILKSVTQYVGWDSPETAGKSQIITWFWNHLTSLTIKEKKQLLVFVTGSDRLPATGIQNLNFKISLLDFGKDSNRLPLAHTCFNELAIYNYSSLGKFVDKLTQAVNESEGFGLK